MNNDSVLSARTVGLLLCTVAVLAGCEGTMSDLIWIQQKTVALNGADFERCVTFAMGSVSGVSINTTRSTNSDIALNVKLTQTIPFLGVDVQHRANDTAEILFTGKGTHESDAERAAITPLLESIAAAVSKACAKSSETVLTLKDVQFFKAQEISSSPLTIRISGLAFHSSLAVRNITVAQDKNSLQVLVHLTPAAENLSVTFSYDLIVPNSIDMVSFGEEKALIWHRSP